MNDTVIDMILFCPQCGVQHIDEPNEAKQWTNPPHRSHECQVCGCIWRPCDQFTNGVANIKTHGKADTYVLTRNQSVAYLRQLFHQSHGISRDEYLKLDEKAHTWIERAEKECGRFMRMCELKLDQGRYIMVTRYENVWCISFYNEKITPSQTHLKLSLEAGAALVGMMDVVQTPQQRASRWNLLFDSMKRADQEELEDDADNNAEGANNS